MNKCGTKSLNISYNSPLLVLTTISTVLYQQIFDFMSDPSSQSSDPSLKSLKMNKCGTKSLNILYNSPLLVLTTISTVLYQQIFDLSSDPSSQSSDPSLKSLKMGQHGQWKLIPSFFKYCIISPCFCCILRLRRNLCQTPVSWVSFTNFYCIR